MASTYRALGIIAVSILGARAHGGNWPAWRGPSGQGLTAETALPLKWSPTDNVRWKTPLPAAGNSTPIVWRDDVFLTQASDAGKTRATLCLRRADGSLRWRRVVEYSAAEPTHEDNPYCSASPVTDGERVIVVHGSAGVHCYGLDGSTLWTRDLGTFHHVWGNAASPVLHGDLCIINCGPGEKTFLLALKKDSGETAWKVDIPGGREGGDSKTWTGSWSTPLIHESTLVELLMTFPNKVYSFDPRTGDELWSCEGLGKLVYTSPLVADDVVVGMSGYKGPALAVRLGGRGDVTETHRLWHAPQAPQRIGSGVARAGHVYILNDSGVAECIELRTGERVWRERLGGRSWSSMILAGERIYVLSERGECFVLRASPRYELLATNALEELTRASPAVSDGELFIRTYRHLWCIAESKK